MTKKPLPPPTASRTVPITNTLTPVPGYPDKLKIYQIAASPFWQVRLYDSGKTIKRSTGTTDKREAFKVAKSLYEQTVVNKWNGVAISKSTRFDVCTKKMLDLQAGRVARKEFTEMSHQNDIYLLDGKILPVFREMDITEIKHDILQDFVEKIGANLSPSSIQRHLGIVRKVLDYAIDRNLLQAMPKFPRVQKRDQPRGWFSTTEYYALRKRAKELVGTEHIIRANPKGKQKQGNLIRRLKFTHDLPNMISFMVNGFIRPTDLKNMQHKHVAIVRNDYTYLRLTLPVSKSHDKPIATMKKAVEIYERLKNIHAEKNLTNLDDYVFMPEFPNRGTALRRLEQQFNYLLDDLGIKNGVRGEARTIYSLRHTCIMFRLLYGDGIDLLTLARNARTSVEMIDRFYASELTGEMNIGQLQSDRRKRRTVPWLEPLDLATPDATSPTLKLADGVVRIEQKTRGKKSELVTLDLPKSSHPRLDLE